MAIVKIEDFTNGTILISTSTNKENDLAVTIDEIELAVLQRLFGKELYDEFILDLAEPVVGKPTEDRFVEVFEPFYKDDEDDCFIFLESEGIKTMLMRFIWCEYVRDQPFQNAVVGMVRNVQENSTIATGAEYGWPRMYNKAVNSYSSIQRFMIQEDDIYPEFKGVLKKVASII